MDENQNASETKSAIETTTTIETKNADEAKTTNETKSGSESESESESEEGVREGKGRDKTTAELRAAIEYLQANDSVKIDKEGRIVARTDGGVYPMQWLWLILSTAAVGFVTATIVLATFWAVLAFLGVFGYAIDAANAAQNHTTSALETYIRYD